MCRLNYFLQLSFLWLVNCQEDPKCTESKLRMKIPKMCCNGEYYNIGRDIKVHDTCKTQPNDDRLSFGESIWLAYDCNIRIALNSTPLTLQSFVDLMSDLPESRQADLWKKITIEPISTSSSSDESHKAHAIKSYWESYFGAVRKVCLTTPTPDQVESVTLKPNQGTARKRMIDLFKPSAKCKEGSVPRNIISAYFQPQIVTNRSEYKTCRNKMNDAIGNVTARSVRVQTRIFCSIASDYSFNLDDLVKTNPDIDHIVQSMFPKFLSKSAKALAVDHAQKWLLMKSGTNSTSFQELLQWHRNNLQTISALKKGMEFNNGDILATGIFFGHLFKAYDTVKSRMCTGFDSLTKTH